MPWINQDMCTGCGICVVSCPVDAVWQQETGKALIDNDKCIRCGRCHLSCSNDAVRHDSEKIPELIEGNMAKTLKMLNHYDKSHEQRKFIDRMLKHYTMQRKVADMTVKQLEFLKNGLGLSTATSENIMKP